VDNSAGPDRDRGRPPDWALAQAMNGRDDDAVAGQEQRAWELVRDFEEERHCEDDDPDQGGDG